jgi:hypothetical protein
MNRAALVAAHAVGGYLGGPDDVTTGAGPDSRCDPRVFDSLKRFGMPKHGQETSPDRPSPRKREEEGSPEEVLEKAMYPDKKTYFEASGTLCAAATQAFG